MNHVYTVGVSVGGVLAAVNEEKIIWSINARSVSTMNVAKMKKLSEASIYLYAEKEGAVEMFKEAVNCKACHSKHKPE